MLRASPWPSAEPFESQPKPVWVGVAIRYADGRVESFEFAEGAEVKFEEERPDPYSWRIGDPLRAAFGRFRVGLRIMGETLVARHFTEWDQPPDTAQTRPAAITAPPRVIEGAVVGE